MPSITPSLPYVCPACRGALTASPEAYACAACARSYPIIFGIPDFRLRPDPYIGLEEDRAKGLRIAREAVGRDLRGLLEFYWSITPEVEPARARVFVESVLAGGGRGLDILHWLESGPLGGPLAPEAAVLEIGCGAGAALAALAGRPGPLVGVDRAFRWLVAAKMALEREGKSAQLVCADARELPFAEGAFALALADGVIEHTDEDQGRIAAEAARVLSAGGVFFAATPNRLAPLPDPHYRVFALGWLPRAWRPAAVRLARGKEYRHISLLGPVALKRILRRAGLRSVSVGPAAFGDETAKRLRGPAGAAFAAYRLAARLPGARWALGWIAPALWATGRKE